MNKLEEEILTIIQKKMVNKDIGFFRNMIVYKMAQAASNMKATVTYIGGKKIPVNVYALSAASSGLK